jgi:hypothetical protein
MSFFIMVVTFLMSNGQQGVSVTKFDTGAECYSAMTAVVRQAPNVTITCQEIPRGE